MSHEPDLNLDKIKKDRPPLSPENAEIIREKAEKMFASIADIAKNIKLPEFTIPNLPQPIEVDNGWIVAKSRRDAEAAELRRLMLEEYREKRREQISPEESFIDRVKFLVPTTDGGFRYKEKILRNLSIDQAEGRLLALFLQSEARFIKDQDALTLLKLLVNHDYSFVIRDLKNAFKNNGLMAIIERRKANKGYIFIDIEEAKKRTIRLKT